MTPFLRFRKNIGEVWKLPLSVSRTLLATSFSVSPFCCALVRSTLILKVGIVELLLDACIDDAGDLAYLVQQLVGHGAIGVDVVRR